MHQINFIGVTPTDLITEIANTIENSLFAKIQKTLRDNQPNQYLSADEVCKRFAVTKPTIHEWKRRNILKSYKLGSRVYYRMDDIENAMIVNN